MVDEAHKLSASFFGGEVHYTKRHRLGQLLSGLTRHFLLMTATPHNGKETDFQLFLALLDGGTVPELMAALAAAGATSASATLADGSAVTVIAGAPSFVNADFYAAFPGGVPAGTILAVRSLN